MVEKRSVSFNEYTIGIIKKAEQIWPENADNFSRLIQSIIVDWWRLRGEVGGSESDLLYSLMFLATREDGETTFAQIRLGGELVKACWKSEE